MTCFLHCPSITAQAGEPGTAVRQAGACAGSFNSSWDDLGSGLSELKLPRNDLNQQLLPATWGQAWPNLWHLELSGSNISSTLPKQWGLGGAFQKLSKLILAGNTNLTGLPQPPRSSTSDEIHCPQHVQAQWQGRALHSPSDCFARYPATSRAGASRPDPPPCLASRCLP